MAEAPLPSNSHLTIDDLTINGNASIVMLWARVIQKAIESGDARWLRVDDGTGIRSVLVHSASKVTTFLSYADFPDQAREVGMSETTNSNLAVWVEQYLDREDSLWNLVEAIGIDKEIATNKAAAE